MALLKKFVIVSFVGEIGKSNLLEIIPSNWISSDEKRCYWPDYDYSRNMRQFERDVRLCTTPEEKWHMEDISKIYGSSGTYAGAREKLRYFLENSNYEVSSSERDEFSGKRRKRAPIRYSPLKAKGKMCGPDNASTSSSSDECDSRRLEDMPRSESLLITGGRDITAIPMQRKAFKSPGEPRQLSSGEGRMPMGGPSVTLHNGSRDKSCKDNDGMFMVGSSTELSKTLEYLVKMVVELQDEVKVLTRKVHKLAGSTTDASINPALEELLKIYPLKTWEDFEHSEMELNSTSLRQSMVVHFSQYNHSCVKGSIKSIMMKVLDPEFAKNLNWAGRGLKKGIKQSHLQGVVKGAVRMSQSFKSTPIDALENEIKKWLIFSFRLASSYKKPQAAVRNNPGDGSGDEEGERGF